MVNAHGAGITYDKGRYSSSDLTNWQFERVVLPVQKDGILGQNRVGERAKVMKCPLMFYCCFIQ